MVNFKQREYLEEEIVRTSLNCVREIVCKDVNRNEIVCERMQQQNSVLINIRVSRRQ
jgi:hypothetical protein